MLCYGPLIEQYDFKNSGKDDTGLGQWVMMVFQGPDGIVTWVVCGYNPCYNKRKQSWTSYQQHWRYFIQKEKDRIIVCMDANKHSYDKAIGKTLTKAERLGMKEAISTFTGKKLGAKFFRGIKPIDGVWYTPDVSVTGACDARWIQCWQP